MLGAKCSQVFLRTLSTSSIALNAAKSPLAKLRKSTGYSLSLCKKALDATEQDVAKAQEWLKEQALAQGWDKANKLEGRNTAQGLVGVLVKDNTAAMIELNCETDFVARNKVFHELLNEIVSVSLKNAPKSASAPSPALLRRLSKEELSAMTSATGSARTLSDFVALHIGQLGENIVLQRGVTLTVDSNVKLACLTHPSANIHSGPGKVQYGKYGALLAYTASPNGTFPEGQNEQSMARGLCQHIIGMNPVRVGDMSSLPSPGSEPPEREQPEEKSAASEVEGDEDSSDSLPVRKNDSEDLVLQDFLLDQDVTVGQVLRTTGIEVKDFVRFELGQEAEC